MLLVFRKGFTLLELIVVIVILGIVAAISVPAFSNVISRSQLETDKISLQSLARLQAADAAFNLNVFSPSNVYSNIVANSPWKITEATPLKFSEVAFAVHEDNTLTMKTRSTSGKHCLAAKVNDYQIEVAVEDFSETECIVTGGIKEPVNPPNPTNPTDPTEPTDPTDPETPVTPPSSNFKTPTGLKHSFVEEKVTVLWDVMSGAVGYKLFVDASNVINVDANTHSWEMTPGQWSVASVSAVYEKGESLRTQPVVLKLPPKIITGTVEENQTDKTFKTISWDKATGATSYEVFTSNGEIINSQNNTLQVFDNDKSFVLKGNPGQSVTYHVISKAASGQSEPYVKTTVFTPAVPTLTASLNNNSQAALTWAPVNGATSYKVFKDGIFLTQTGSVTYNDTISLGKQHVYTITAINAGGESSLSNSVTVLNKPAAPQNVQVTNNATNVSTVTWDTVPGVSYSVLIADATNKNTLVETSVGTSSSFTFSKKFNLNPGEPLTITVLATNTAGSTPTNKTILAGPAISGLGVSFLILTVQPTQTIANASQYVLEKSVNGGVYTVVATMNSPQLYTEINLTLGATYSYRYKAIINGQSTLYSYLQPLRIL